MAIHTLTFGDGATVQVEAPRGTSKEDLVDLVNKQERADREAARLRRQEARQAEMEQGIPDFVPIPEETGVLGDLRKGFGAGFVGTGEMAALGAATLLDEEAELAARSKIQGIADAIKPKGGDQDDLSYKIGSVFGSIAGFAAPIAGIAAGIGAAPISLGAAATTGIATGAGALLGVGTAAGEASERARAAGATQEERNRAIRQAAPFGLLEVAPLGRFMRSVDVPVINRLMDQLGPEVVETMGQRISNAAVTGGAEAAQEATAEIVQNLAERGYNPERAILEGTGESAALGGGAGATIQFLVDAFTNSRKAGIDGAPQEVTPEAEPEGGIAGLLPSPAAVQRSVGPQAVAKFRSWEDANPEEAARLTDAERTAKIKQYYDELSVKQPESRYIPKGLQLTGPDDLGIRLDSGEGQAITREQSMAAREKAADVVKRARAEIRSTGEVSSKTFGELREATRTGAIPFEETASILENTRFEPALDLIEGTDLPAGVAAPEVKTQPVQDKARFDAAVANAKSGIGALAGRESALAQDAARERAKQAALERDDVDAFEQPDLFALELEQARRDPRGRALQNIPTPEPEVAPQPTTEQERELLQRDLFNAAQVGTQDASANIRRAREAERQKQEDIDVDTELGLREMQARVAEPERRRKDRERPEQLSFRGDLRQPKTITKSTLTMKDVGEPLDARPVDTATSGVGVPPVGPSSADGPTAAAPSAPDTTTPDGRGVGRAVRGAGRADAPTEPQPTTLTDEVLQKSEDSFDNIRAVLDVDTQFAKDELKAVLVGPLDYSSSMDGATDAELTEVRQGIYNRTQNLLKDKPDEIIVYRIGNVPENTVKSFTLNPNFKADLTLPWVEGEGKLQAYKVKKSDILGSPDITKRGPIGEDEVIINTNNVKLKDTATLTGRERQGPDRPVTRQRIPGTRVRVDKQTLVAKGKPQFVEDPTLAPEPVKETTKQTFATQKADTATKKRA